MPPVPLELDEVVLELLDEVEVLELFEELEEEDVDVLELLDEVDVLELLELDEVPPAPPAPVVEACPSKSKVPRMVVQPRAEVMSRSGKDASDARRSMAAEDSGTAFIGATAAVTMWRRIALTPARIRCLIR